MIVKDSRDRIGLISYITMSGRMCIIEYLETLRYDQSRDCLFLTEIKKVNTIT
jgi:hypothetical protein